MRAIGCARFGPPEVLEPIELPEPHARAGEVRIRVHAATVNPTDTLRRSGALAEWMGDQAPPYVPGMEMAGIVDEVGSGDVSHISIGDAVMAIVLPDGSSGGYAQHVVVPADSTVRCPRDSTFAEAATVPMNGLTALLALDTLELEPGATLAVTGAAGAVGGYVIELARAAGLRVIADASEVDEPLVRELGADVVIRRGVDFADRVRKAVPAGVDGLVDAALLNTLALPAVRDFGGLAVLRPVEIESERGVRVLFIAVPRYATERAKLEQLRGYVEEGIVTPRIAKAFPADQAPAAHRLLESGGVRGRLVLEFE